MTEALAPPEEIGVIQLLREDRVRNGRSVFKPGFLALAVHRFGVRERNFRAPVRVITTPLYNVLFGIVRGVFGIEIERSVEIGRRLLIGHQSGIIIHPHAKIGNNVLLRQNVTVGGVTENWLSEAPVLEDNVSVGAGAIIMGKITVGAGARIGPNVVVTRNVPAGATVVAPPPRVLKPRVARVSDDESGAPEE